jgi:hypothetical protein
MNMRSLARPALRWSPGAAALMTAMRARTDDDGWLYAEEALGAMLFGTAIGVSATSAILRDPTITRDPILLSLGSNPGRRVGSRTTDIEIESENRATAEGVRTVGERHVVQAVLARLQGPGVPSLVNGAALSAAVKEAEVGPGFDLDDITGRWHGLLDTVVILQCADIQDIIWSDEVAAPAVVLWAGISLLNELDQQAYYHHHRRVRNRAGAFGRWLAPQLDTALSRDGLQLREGVQLRVWGNSAPVGARDTDHLQTAEALHERGVGVHIVTRDLGMSARAWLMGIPVHRLSDRWTLPPSTGPLDDKG